MPQKRVNLKKTTEQVLVKSRTILKSSFELLTKKIVLILASIFFIIWILIGIFILLVIIQGFRQGTYQQYLNPQKRDTAQDPQSQAPNEVALPGIGTVNVECVQTSISTESISKLVETGSTDSLEGEEKAKFEKCIVEKDTSSPATSTAP